MPNINECGVKVLYPMDVQCSVVNPTTLTSSDGSATLIISGGTPPYSILWDNGDLTNSRHNLMGGEYSASVTDYYGDFIINTTCVLTQPQPTTTTTTTTTTVQPTYTLCMNISRVIESFTTFTQITFNPSGLYLGYQSWISQDSIYKLYWDQTITSWKLSGSTMNVISPDPSYPPLNGWQLLGGFGFGTVSVNQGACIPRPVTSFKFTTTNPTCTCDGGIIIQATGPDTPFQYSINNGLNWFNSPVFTNLCGGVYPLAVKDSLGNIYRDSATLNAVIPTITYTLQYNEYMNNDDGRANLTYRISANPPLPPGVTITFDILLRGYFSRTPFSGSATNNFNYRLTKSSVIIPVSDTNVVNSTTPNTLCTQYMVYNTLTTEKWTNLTIQGDQSYDLRAVSLRTFNCSYVEEGNNESLIETRFNTDDSIKFGFIVPNDTSAYSCCNARIEIGTLTENVRISGCDCCKVVLGGGSIDYRS